MDAIARPVGQPPARIDKRPGDHRAYLVDCSPLLRQYELLVRVEAPPTATLGLTCQARPARGARALEVRLAGGSVPDGKSHADCPLRMTVVTTQGSLDLALTARVHRE